MKKHFAMLASLLSLFGVAGSSSASEKSPITVEQLQKMFAGMKADTKWNLEGPLLWGYFFFDANPNKLQPVAEHLVQARYRFVNVYPADDKSTYVLHVEKVEHHTVQSLDQRNQEFYRLAETYHLASYDGIDVGLAPQSQLMPN